MDFKDKLIKLRKERSLSQEELGEKLDVSRQTISKWELGQTTPEMNKLIELSNLFEISIDSLIKEENIIGEEQKQEIILEHKRGIYDVVILLLKIFGIIILIGFIITVISAIMFSTVKKEESIVSINQILE